MIESENTQFYSPKKQGEDDLAITEAVRSTSPLTAYVEQPGIGGANRQDAEDRIAEIENIIQDNPDRISHDANKAPQERTIHDPELAHLIALTVDSNMTALTGLSMRIKSGRSLHAWQKSSQEKNLLGAALGEKLATDVYNANPISAGANSVNELKQAAIHSGHKDYKLIK